MPRRSPTRAPPVRPPRHRTTVRPCRPRAAGARKRLCRSAAEAEVAAVPVAERRAIAVVRAGHVAHRDGARLDALVRADRIGGKPAAVVTGGAGFIGSHLVDALLGAGWLLIKTSGALQAKAVHWARRAWWGAVAGFLAVSLVSPPITARKRSEYAYTPALAVSTFVEYRRSSADRAHDSRFCRNSHMLSAATR